MKVKELIEQLSRFDSEMDVKIVSMYGNESSVCKVQLSDDAYSDQIEFVPESRKRFSGWVLLDSEDQKA